MNNINKKIIQLAKKIWDYHHLNQKIRKSDAILVLGSHDLRVAEYGAELFLQKWAPILIFSGGLGNLTKNIWKEPEADKFAKIARKMGVPKSVIYVENKSTNTAENILFTKELIKQKKLNLKSFIVVHKPYMERRTYATFKKLWPSRKIIVTSPKIPFEDYPNKKIPLNKVINIIVGDLQRIKIYSENGFQIFQKIPKDVWKAYEELVKFGYVKHLIR